MEMRFDATPSRTRYRLTASARRSESFWLYAALPTESVCPSTVTRRSGLSRMTRTAWSRTSRPSAFTSARLKSKLAAPTVAIRVPRAGGAGGGGGGACASTGGGGASFSGSQSMWPSNAPSSAPPAVPAPTPATMSCFETGDFSAMSTPSPPPTPPRAPPRKAPPRAQGPHRRSRKFAQPVAARSNTPTAVILNTRMQASFRAYETKLAGKRGSSNVRGRGCQSPVDKTARRAFCVVSHALDGRRRDALNLLPGRWQCD